MLFKHNEELHWGRRSSGSSAPHVVVFNSGTALWSNMREIGYGFSLSLASFCSCRKSGVCTLRYREHKLVDCRWRGDSPPCGHRHHFHPILETLPHRQAGVPARCHDLNSAETEGRAAAKFFFIPLYCLLMNRQEVVLRSQVSALLLLIRYRNSTSVHLYNKFMLLLLAASLHT